jgi:hypothetical protein
MCQLFYKLNSPYLFLALTFPPYPFLPSPCFRLADLSSQGICLYLFPFPTPPCPGSRTTPLCFVYVASLRNILCGAFTPSYVYNDPPFWFCLFAFSPSLVFGYTGSLGAFADLMCTESPLEILLTGECFQICNFLKWGFAQ